MILDLTQWYTKVPHQILWSIWSEGTKGAIILKKDINAGSKPSSMDKVSN
jgi:hypothetical protein